MVPQRLELRIEFTLTNQGRHNWVDFHWFLVTIATMECQPLPMNKHIILDFSLYRIYFLEYRHSIKVIELKLYCTSGCVNLTLSQSIILPAMRQPLCATWRFYIMTTWIINVLWILIGWLAVLLLARVKWAWNIPCG